MMGYEPLSSRCLRFCVTQSHLTNQTTCHLIPTVILPALVRWVLHLINASKGSTAVNCSPHCIPFLISCSISHLHQIRKHLSIFSLVFYHNCSVVFHTLPSPINLPRPLKAVTLKEFLAISMPTPSTPTQNTSYRISLITAATISVFIYQIISNTCKLIYQTNVWVIIIHQALFLGTRASLKLSLSSILSHVSP